MENNQRSREEFEYELLDTGVFDDDRYFDVFVEYAKEAPEDVAIRITVHNRGPEAAKLRVLPTLWFRNTWSFRDGEQKPILRAEVPGVIQASHPELDSYWLYCDGKPELLFTENETNTQRLWGQANSSPFVKDGFHNYLIAGDGGSVNPARIGTKAAAHYALEVPGGGKRRFACASPPSRRTTRSAGSKGSSKDESPTPTNFTTGSLRLRSTRISGWSTGRLSPECSGASSSTTSTWIGGLPSTSAIRSSTGTARVRGTWIGSTC